jgi:hypothetical protein
MMREGRIVAAWVALLLAVPLGIAAEEGAPAGEPEQDEQEMTSYQLVLVLENDELEEPLSEKMMARLSFGHEHWVKNLLNDTAALIAGSIDGHEVVEEVAIMDLGTTEAAESAFGGSPLMAQGAGKLEVYSLWAPKGVLRKAENPVEREAAYLGLLLRPDRPRHYPKEELLALESGHAAHLQQLVDSGDLVLAGELEDAEALQELLIFRTTDPRRIRTLVESDPLVEGGRLRLELYPWWVPKGSFPDLRTDPEPRAPEGDAP